MIRFEGSEALRTLAVIERRILDAARLGMSEVVKVAYRSARDTTLFKDQTQELRGTLDITDLGAYRKRLIARAKHSVYIEKGTRPHVIKPKDPDGWLRFVIGGRVIFAKKVNHPGTAARPFMQNAAMAGSQAMSVVLNEGFAKAAAWP